jgi:hypothetical protein
MLSNTEYSENYLSRGVSEVMLDEVIPGNNAPEVLNRYQNCAQRIWELFEEDPLGNSSAHFLIERLEALLDQGLLVPKESAVPKGSWISRALKKFV